MFWRWIVGIEVQESLLGCPMTLDKLFRFCDLAFSSVKVLLGRTKASVRLMGNDAWEKISNLHT